MTVVLMGVSGVGKSSVLNLLAQRLAATSAEGDTFHSPANIAKMGAGTSLTDDDRWPWLRSIAAWIGDREREDEDAVVACSALRRTYRDLLRDGHPSVRFVHLVAPSAVVEQRLGGRLGHYMPASLLKSQIRTLEPLAPDEPGLAVVADRPPPELADEIAAAVRASSCGASDVVDKRDPLATV